MKWVTRERPRINCIACPCLIKGFINPNTEFLYVSADAVLHVAEETNAVL